MILVSLLVYISRNQQAKPSATAPVAATVVAARPSAKAGGQPARVSDDQGKSISYTTPPIPYRPDLDKSKYISSLRPKNYMLVWQYDGKVSEQFAADYKLTPAQCEQIYQAKVKAQNAVAALDQAHLQFEVNPDGKSVSGKISSYPEEGERVSADFLAAVATAMGPDTYAGFAQHYAEVLFDDIGSAGTLNKSFTITAQPNGGYNVNLQRLIAHAGPDLANVANTTVAIIDTWSELPRVGVFVTLPEPGNPP